VLVVQAAEATCPQPIPLVAVAVAATFYKPQSIYLPQRTQLILVQVARL
jgi:hypothetical protein